MPSSNSAPESVRRLLDIVDDPVAQFDATTGVRYANAAWKALALSLTGDVGAPPARLFSQCKLLRPADDDKKRGTVLQLQDGKVYESRVFRDTKGDVFWLREITESWRMGQESRHLEALYRTLSLCNQALVHAEEEVALSQVICDNLVRSGEFCAAWVYLTQHGSAPVLVARSSMAETSMDVLLQGRIHPHSSQLEESRISGQPLLLPAEASEQTTATVTMELYPLGSEHRLLGYLVVAADPVSFSRQSEFGLLHELAGDLYFGIQTMHDRKRLARLQKTVQQAAVREKTVLEAVIAALASLVEKRDPYTAGHQRRVARLALFLGQRLGMTERALEGLVLAATIHDIGKVGVPIDILVKSSKLAPAEFELVKQHPTIGAEVIAGIDFPSPVADYIRHHHEKLDGSGYPDGLAGDALSLPVRILTVADVVEAMMNHRPYRPALGIEATLEYLTQNKGRLFDPAVVDACVGIVRSDGFALD